MARQVVLDLGDYADGDHTYGPANLPGNVSSIGFEMQRCTTLTPDIWPNESTTIDAWIEASIDGGVTWVACGGCEAKGGIHIRRDGTEQQTTWFRTYIPAGNGRKVRGGMTIAGGPLRTSVAITFA